MIFWRGPDADTISMLAMPRLAGPAGSRHRHAARAHADEAALHARRRHIRIFTALKCG